jgi:hypothetical protein
MPDNVIGTSPMKENLALQLTSFGTSIAIPGHAAGKFACENFIAVSRGRPGGYDDNQTAQAPICIASEPIQFRQARVLVALAKFEVSIQKVGLVARKSGGCGTAAYCAEGID